MILLMIIVLVSSYAVGHNWSKFYKYRSDIHLRTSIAISLVWLVNAMMFFLVFANELK